MSLKIKRRPKKNLRKSTKPMRCWATPRSARNTTSSARIGIVRAVFNRRLTGKGKDSNLAADFINGAETAEFNSSSTEPDSATSSKHSSAAAVAARRLADSVDVRRQRNVAPT